jgi:hypothetical protein
LLAFHALDARYGNGLLQIESRAVGGGTVISLRPTTPLAFAIDRDRNRLVLGSSAEAVQRALTLPPQGTKGDFERLRAARFPEAGSFACIDLVRLHQYVLTFREPLVARLAARQHRDVADVQRDLDRSVELMALFRQAYLTSTIEPDATAVHRELGVIARAAAP